MLHGTLDLVGFCELHSEVLRVLASCYYGDQLEENKMGSSYNTYRRDEKYTQEIVGKSERKRTHSRQ